MSAPERERGTWYPAEKIWAIAYETPIVGWRGRHVNALRLWSARANDPAGTARLPHTHYDQVMAANAQADAICASLYPSDATPAGRELRLRQEYFFTSASLQDIVHQHLQSHDDLSLAAVRGRHPAQRHPSGDRGRRADAAVWSTSTGFPGRMPGT